MKMDNKKVKKEEYKYGMRRINRSGDSYIRDALIIAAITLVIGVLLAVVFQITMRPIQKAELDGKEVACKAVFPEPIEYASEDVINEKVNKSQDLLKDQDLEGNYSSEALMAKDSVGARLGYVFIVSSTHGYGGNLSISMGITSEGILQGIEMVSMNETAGLGANCTTDSFKDQYKNLSTESALIVTKDGKKADNEIDAISGATITSKAVTDAVNAGIAFYQTLD